MVINLHLATGTGLGRLAAISIDIVARGLGVASGVVRTFEVVPTTVRVEWLFFMSVERRYKMRMLDALGIRSA